MECEIQILAHNDLKGTYIINLAKNEFEGILKTRRSLKI